MLSKPVFVFFSFSFDPWCFCHPKGTVVVAMAVLRATLVALMVHRTASVTTTLANCQSACNLGEMLCLNKNASSTLCSAVQGACMAGCYASRVDCGCADASVTHCVEIELQAPHARENFPHRSLTVPRNSPSGTYQSKFSSRWSQVCLRYWWSSWASAAAAWTGRAFAFPCGRTISSSTSSRRCFSGTMRPRRRRARLRSSRRRERAVALRLSRMGSVL